MTLLRYPSDLVQNPFQYEGSSLHQTLGLLRRGAQGVGGLLRQGAQAVGPAMGGVDPSVQDPSFDPRQAMSNALMSAGNTMVQAGGGPMQWGQTRGSPLASVMAGLAAGRESYQTAQQGGRDAQQTSERYRGLMQNAPDTRTGLMRVFDAAIRGRDIDVARFATTQLTALGTPGSTVAEQRLAIQRRSTADQAAYYRQLYPTRIAAGTPDDVAIRMGERLFDAAHPTSREPRPSSTQTPADRTATAIQSRIQRYMQGYDDNGNSTQVRGYTQARLMALGEFPDAPADVLRRFPPPTAQQRAWDALPGSVADKAARVGPRP